MPASEQGNFSDRYMMIPRNLIFLFCEGKVLLLKGSPDKKVWANKYNGIGGHVEQGEDLLAAARRELLEESGLRDESLDLAGIVTIDTGQSVGITLYVWKGTQPKGELAASGEGLLEWVKMDSLENLPLVEDLPTILPLVQKKQPNDPPFLAKYYYQNKKLIITLIM